MRLLATFTPLAVILTLAIHNVSTSPVEPAQQGDQVNQSQNDLSKGADATCTFVDNQAFTKENQDAFYKFLTNIDGPNVSCQVTNFVKKLYDEIDHCRVPAIKTELSDVLESLRTVAETPRSDYASQDNNYFISTDEYDTLIILLPPTYEPNSKEMLQGVVDAISAPKSFFSRFPSTSQFYNYVCP